jgi:hypothetical protein
VGKYFLGGLQAMPQTVACHELAARRQMFFRARDGYATKEFFIFRMARESDNTYRGAL